jgi:hypothetical protein
MITLYSILLDAAKELKEIRTVFHICNKQQQNIKVAKIEEFVIRVSYLQKT